MIYILENIRIDTTKDLMIHGQLVSPHMMSTEASRQSLGIEDIYPPEINPNFETLTVLNESPWYRVDVLDLFDCKARAVKLIETKIVEYKSILSFSLYGIQCNLSDSFKLNAMIKMFGSESEKYTNIVSSIAKFEEILDNEVEKLKTNIHSTSSLNEIKNILNSTVLSKPEEINTNEFVVKTKISELERNQHEVVRTLLLGVDNRAKTKLELIDVQISELKKQIKG